MKRALLVVVLAASCRSREPVPPQAEQTIAVHASPALARTEPVTPRVVPAEVFLRSYLAWFGGLSPLDTFYRARPDDLFGQWTDYLAALGLPDYHVDAPRAEQPSTISLATVGGMVEALCIRAVEHDLRDARPLAERMIFAFDYVPGTAPTRAQFAAQLDVVHRTFLSYPVALGGDARIDRFYKLFQDTAIAHAKDTRLTGQLVAWATVCTALAQHPEAGLY